MGDYETERNYDMAKQNLKKDERYYVEKFERLMLEGSPIINRTTKETYIPLEDELFLQCYADTPERKLFPKYWFVSQIGTLISVYNNELRMVHKNKRVQENRYSYKYTIFVDVDGQNKAYKKSIELHNLVGLVFGSYVYGSAKDKLEQKGVYAFGTTPDTVNGHHMDSDATTNNPNELELVTVEVHKLIHSAPKVSDPEEKHFEYMKKLGEIASKEEPRQATILFTDECYDSIDDYLKGNVKHDGKTGIQGTNKLTFTEQGMKDFLTMVQAMQKKEEQTGNE